MLPVRSVRPQVDPKSGRTLRRALVSACTGGPEVRPCHGMEHASGRVNSPPSAVWYAAGSRSDDSHRVQRRAIVPRRSVPMRSARFVLFSTSLLAAALLLSGPGLLAAPTIEVIMSGLDNPRGLAFGPEDALY